ncbi:L [avian paramyxovirus 10]|uniref:RNA-directed RNA polymerase L n=2 Tax=Metaavulavirus falklandense TaxID=2560309 RepID=D9IL78_9MONO|nr:L [Avian paramyxovirus penguin/Falkland Islands/324/2007] [avian paramyxovirus 10]AQQ11606.1 L [Metaavulavirus falklandense] [Metaavulavirus falklandense]ADK12969.2 L [Avian paramyxovirus penguin/Falkland Islands/324/2007] [avian paramyxovirus 10]BAW94655.1 large polymerase protein [Metaavulavirus falklandense]BAW94662.1 large polymerase protein [Metaavulavirus falklandense]BBJ77943.1 large polymerase protein [Metaavulavirus falklandense]
MDQIQSDTIIQPEVHLDSPLIRNKLLLLWKLIGLPLPPELRSAVLTNLNSESNIHRDENKLKTKLIVIRNHLLEHLKRRQLVCQHLTPVLHPKTLGWLLRIECESALTFQKEKNKVLRRVIEENTPRYEHLFSSISHKLTNNSFLFNPVHTGKICQEDPLSVGARAILNDPVKATHTAWTNSRWSWLHLKQVMRYLIKQSRIHQRAETTKCWSEAWGFIGITPDVVVIVDYGTLKFTLLTFEMVLMYADVAEGRDNVMVLSELSVSLNKLSSRLEDLFLLVDSLASDIGERIYDLVATLESLAYAAVQLHDASEVQSGSFFAFNMREIRELLRECIDPRHVGRVCDLLTSIYSGLSPDQSAELLCIMRLFGHPLLIADSAAKKVRESMCAPKMIEHDTVLQTLSFFKGIIINGYRRSHSGVWPVIDVSSIHDDDLRQLYYESSEISHAFMLRKYKALALLEFKKSIDYDLYDDLSTFLKDKAICRPKSQWTAVFRKSLLGREHKCHLLENQKSNRLLIDFLESSDFDPEEEFRYVTSLSYLSDNEFCASYSLKEKEIKTTGRIFAKMTRKMRSCQVILESLLSQHVCKYFKENGVSMEQLSLTKSLLAMSQLSPRVAATKLGLKRATEKDQAAVSMDYGNHNIELSHKGGLRKRKTVTAGFLTTDLQKYCLNWRYASIKLFAQALNQLFGISHGFEWIHLRLMDSTLFVGDPYSPPSDMASTNLDDAPNDSIFIVSPRGGIEGLCQKMWTMISISIIHCVAEKVGTRVAAMVQGDNQVIGITREVFQGETLEIIQPELDALCETYFVEFKKHNFGMGHNLKPNETIKSQSFFVYSKRVFWEGRILSQLLKNATKLCMVADHLGENSVSSCSNLSSTIARLVENGLEKDVAVLLNQVYTMTQLLFDEHYSIVCDYSNVKKLIGSQNYRNLQYATLLPGQVGGFNFLNLSRLFTRNIGDPVTSSLADIKCYIMAGLLPRHILRNIMLREPSDGGWVTLCADPYALNIPYTQLPTTYLKKHTQRSLLAHSTNPLLLGVQIQTQHEEEEALAQFLLDRESVMPRVAHVVMESSILGKRKQIQGLIDTTPTIIKTALMSQPISRKRCDKILQYSINYISACHDSVLSGECLTTEKRMIWDTSLLSEETCSVTLAEFLRASSWKNILGGRGVAGVTSPDTLELITGSLIGENSFCRLCELGDKNFTWMHLPGPFKISAPYLTNTKMRVPYLGSKTEERRAASVATVKGMSHHLKAALRGASVYMWAFGDIEVNWEQACIIANTRCNITMDQLKLLTPIPSSSNIQHRLTDGISVQKFTPASLSRVSSFVHICNDFQKLERDDTAVDSNLIYQQIMLIGLSILEALHPMEVEWVANNQTLHLHTGQSCCPREIDGSIVNEARQNLHPITVTSQNRFLFDNAPLPETASIELYMKNFRFTELNIDAITGYAAIDLLSKCAAQLVSDCILEEGIGSSVKNDALITFDNSINWISEFLMCDIRQLSMYLGQEILNNLAYQLYYLRVIGQQNILLYIKQALERVPVIQFANLALTISHPEVWRRINMVGICSEASGPYVASVDFIAASRDLIEYGCKLYISGLLDNNEPSYVFFNVQDGDLTPKMEQFLARRCCLLVLLSGTQVSLPIIREQNAIEKCATLTQFLVYLRDADKNVSDRVGNLLSISMAPKLESLMTNLYFSTRRVLSNLRESTSARSQIDYLYREDLDSLNTQIDDDNIFLEDPILQRGLFFSFDIDCDEIGTHKFESVMTEYSSGPNCVAIKRQDTYIQHLLKTVGQCSTSWYKYAVLYASERKTAKSSGDSLYIGEGSGSVMTLLEYLEPSHTIFYNSLFFNEMNPPQRNFGLLPLQFHNSIVMKNITSGAPCSLGFIQQFIPLWREIDQETNITDTAFLQLAMSMIKPHTLKRVNCDVEFDEGMPIERIIQGYTHVLMLAAYGLQEMSHLWVKVYRSSEKVFQFVISSLLMIFGKVTIHRNAYMSPNHEEFVLACKTRSCLDYTSVPQIITRVKLLVDRDLTIVTPCQALRIRQEWESLSSKVEKFSTLVVHRKFNLRMTKTDSLLLQLGGKIVTFGGIDIQSLLDLEMNDARKQIIDLIDTALLECKVIWSENDDVDLALMLGPFNINKHRRLYTVAQACTLAAIPFWIWSELQFRTSSVTYLATTVLRGVFSWSTLMAQKEYEKTTKRPRFVKHVVTYTRLSRFFSEYSKIVLTRPESKRLLKLLGSLIKTL